MLEAEVEEAVGAEKGERTRNRQGYRAGYYGRTLVTRVVTHSDGLAFAVHQAYTEVSPRRGDLTEPNKYAPSNDFPCPV